VFLYCVFVILIFEDIEKIEIQKHVVKEKKLKNTGVSKVYVFSGIKNKKKFS